MKAMTLRALIVFICLFSFENFLFSQAGEYKLNWISNGVQTLENEKEVVEFEYLRFEGATFIGENLIPEYSKSISISNYRNEKYLVSNEKFEPVPDSLLKNISTFSSIESHPPQVNVYKSRSDVYLSLNLSALQFNPETGLLERLVQFQLEKDTNTLSVDKVKSNLNLKETSNSLLATGYWYKIKVSKTGIYKLYYSDLESMGFFNLKNVRIFGYGGRQLSFSNSDYRPTDLAECPIYMNTGSDGIFNKGDYILFYAEGPVTWNYNSSNDFFMQKLHDYSSSIYYFITTDHGYGAKIETVNNTGLSEDLVVNSYTDYAYYEKNSKNLIRSGRIWYTEEILQYPVDTIFQFSNYSSSSQAKIKAKVAGRSTSNRSASLLLNDETVDTEFFPTISTTASTNRFAYDEILSHSFSTTNENIKVGVEYQKINLSDQAFLDYITINVPCNLSMNKNPFFFRDIHSIGEDTVAKFVISQVPQNAQVWDVTDINSVFAIAAQQTGSTLEFKAHTDSLREYVIADISYEYPRPQFNASIEGVGQVSNQDLHGLKAYNYIILAKEGFFEQANRLAEYHSQNSGLSVLIVSPEKIYNEFSSGTPDVTALRDFFRHQYKLNSGDDGLKYILLFGDGSYNNHMNVEGNTNFILTYQSANSLEPTSSYQTDDFFGLLGDNEGEEINGTLGGKLVIGIGRLPVRIIKGDDYEARDVVNKILHYFESEMTDWRRTLCFLGDDQSDGGTTDQTEHMQQSDNLATRFENKYAGFETRKIFLDAYPQIIAATGPSYPDAKEELMNLFKKGVLLFNYFGHGSETGITGEKVLRISDIESMSNIDHLPLFITATCEFSRFDDVEMDGNNIIAKTSAGEMVILNPDGGGVALLTTTRAVYSDSNEALVKPIADLLFSLDNSGNPLRLGEIVMRAKNSLGDQKNKLNFVFLGDPAMILKFPRYKILTDSINHISIENQMDTIKAFSEVTVSGYIATDDSAIISGFNGVVYPQVYDKAVEITTLGNDNKTPVTFMEQKNLIYKGIATVDNGRFTFSFVVPKDISYNLGQGKISYYAENGSIDAKGETREIFIGGTDNTVEMDYDGPDIELFMNDERFVDGGMTNSNPYLYAKLHDTNGINTTGIGIGHDLTAILDWDDLKPYVLNEYYLSDTNDYRSGKVLYPLSELEDGEHYLTMKAWDVFNNSSIADISFVVTTAPDLIVNKVLNYPNPAFDYTEFQYTHNFPGEEHQVILEIFDLSGRLVSSISRTMYESGFVSTPLPWKRSLGSNLRAGIYPYRLSVTTSGGTSYISQKLIILR